VAVRWLAVLFRMIEIFFGLSAFELLGSLVVVCLVAVCVFLLNIWLTSGFWPRVRARALRAPVFLGSHTQRGAARPQPLQLRCFLFTP
jgi:hypothetical protein